MTVDQALACLTELRALERLHAAIAELPAPADEWRYGLVALDDRLRLVRYCLSLEDPALLAAVAERYREERRLELPAAVQAQLSHSTGYRIH